MELDQRHLSNVPLLALVAANAVPVVGVLFFGWDGFYLVLLYWAENVIIGFYNVLKMACAKAPSPRKHLDKLFAIPFFIFHYGAFCGVHGVFILAMFKKETGNLWEGHAWPCFLFFVQLLLAMIIQVFSIIPLNMKFAI
jgi:hypothetical protein